MKSTNWQGGLTVRRFKTPTGPLAEVDSGCYVMDFTKQRALEANVIGGRCVAQTTMNSSGEAAQALLTTPDTHGTGSPFVFPK